MNSAGRTCDGAILYGLKLRVTKTPGHPVVPRFAQRDRPEETANNIGMCRNHRSRCRAWRAYLDLDFRVTEKRRFNKLLDTLKKEYRRRSTAHRGQHKTQRGVGVFVVVDIENFLRSSKTFHQKSRTHSRRPDSGF